MKRKGLFSKNPVKEPLPAHHAQRLTSLTLTKRRICESQYNKITALKDDIKKIVALILPFDPHVVGTVRLAQRDEFCNLPVFVLGLILLLTGFGEITSSEASVENRPSADRELLVIDITGAEYEWYLRYPGPDGILNTADDGLDMRDLHLPAETNVRLQLHSKDYVYSFALPHLDLKEIAIPDLVFTLSFTTGQKGAFDLLGDQLCGYAHPKLMGNLIILSPAEFATQMSRLSKIVDG